MTTIDEFYKVGPGPSSSHTGSSEEEVFAFVDKIINTMVATVKSGLGMPEDDVLPGPIKLHTWTAYPIASSEIETRHRVSFDECVQALAQTAKEMNSKYKEMSEAGLALSVVLC